MSKDQPYTLRRTAMQISRLSADPRIDALAIKQIEIISQLLGEPIPKEFPTRQIVQMHKGKNYRL